MTSDPQLDMVHAADALYADLCDLCHKQSVMVVAAAIGRLAGENMADIDQIKCFVDTILLNAVMATTTCTCPDCGPVTIN